MAGRPARKAGGKGPRAKSPARKKIIAASKKALQSMPGPKARAKLSIHSRKCKVCKHPHRKEIERLFIKGLSTHELARLFDGLDHKNIYTHIISTDLDDQLKNATLTTCNYIINSYGKIEDKEPSDALMVSALKLRAQITGELKEKNELKIDINHRINLVADQRIKNLCKRFGMTPEEIEEVLGEPIESEEVQSG